ncbi:regenerating islet-derived protein 4-like isoform X1 [Sceloporus undulatus]|uniref:regenerating islet-derived protein 4-like isoform X1 n=1 Tax=Sceloporus undulatus TaxID=8520 RepID=UPI001C4D7688|nr:regenerating islet-derived protein 4-like isoform X1 [Sceloporus undulatus]
MDPREMPTLFPKGHSSWCKLLPKDTLQPLVQSPRGESNLEKHLPKLLLASGLEPRCPPWLTFSFVSSAASLLSPTQKRICGEWVEGAHLASILTPSEERMVTNYIKRYTKAKIVWIGLKAERADNELIWNWSDFSLYDSGSALWDDEKPKTCPSDKNEECIALSNVQNPAETPRWAQYPCRHSYQFICKYRASS